MNTSFWIRVCLKTLLVFSPVIVATVIIFGYGNGSDTLSVLNNIGGNEYPINNILLAYIVSGYLVVFIGLIFYMLGVFDDVFRYSGRNKKVARLNKTCIFLLGTVLAFIVLYSAFFSVSVSGDVSRRNKIFNLHNLVLFNKYLSLFIFFIFFIADILINASQKIQLKENVATNEAHPTSKLRLEILHNQNNLQLSKNATWFINVPTLLLTGLAILFTGKVFHIERFKGYVDQSFKASPEIPNQLDDKLFDLFLNGLETGVITSVIIISQIIFIAIKTRWELRRFEIEPSTNGI